MKRSFEEELAGQILDYVRDRLVIFMPYFNRALLLMPVTFRSAEKGGSEEQSGSELYADCALASDGAQVYADPEKVIALFGEEEGRLVRAYLHMIFHCVLLHPFHPEEERKTWDLAADLAAEKAVLDLAEGPPARLPDDEERSMILRDVTEYAGSDSAEQICHWLAKGSPEAKAVIRRADLFRMDRHSLWLSGGGGKGRIVYSRKSAADSMEKQPEKWLRVQQAARVANLSRRGSMGEQAGKGVRYPGRPDRDDYDYTEFLLQFASESEVVEVNPDEFDYIYYTYGLSLYRNMPLVEPLEYRDARRICDFVIALDTSGSCQGHVLKEFLNKTWSILKNSSVFTNPMNLHIIQCDCEIQSEVTIRDDEAFTAYMESIEIRGAGGTDFRPVFDRIDEHIKSGEFHDFRGLLYFTDGFGRFPEVRPVYRTAFVFVGDRVKVPELPAWAEYRILKSTGVTDEY